MIGPGPVRMAVAAVVVAAFAVMSGGPDSGASTLAQTSQGAAPAAQAATFHCAPDATCPEILIAGDPHATISGNPAPFRGYGDPSLELDPDTGTLWLSYSWLDVLVSDPGPPPVIDFGVRTHLARSDDGGSTFTFVRQLNDWAPIQHPDHGTDGWPTHEVSTLVREGPGAWQNLWLTYFDPFGPAQRYDYFYQRTLASSPDALGDSSTAWAQGYGTSASWNVAHDLSAEIPELSDCFTPTEPALFAYGGETYLATNCVVIDQTGRRDDLERLVLLRQEANGYSYVGELLDYDDAVFLGGSRFEQVDLSVAQNGAILLIGTPIQNDAEPNHLGCIALEVVDIESAQVRRDASGDPVVLAEITGEDPMLGPGLCTYDAASTTGVMMVLHIQSVSPFDIEFSLRSTGVHPQGLDGDSDGVADTVDNCLSDSNGGQVDADGDGVGDVCDNCPSAPNPWQENNSQPGTPAGDYCDDIDFDLVPDAIDNCPYDPNAGQEDSDGNGIGNACDGCQVTPDYIFDDADDDCIPDDSDNCPTASNVDQDDADSDGTGDACDAGDTDFDSVTDEREYHCGSLPSDGASIPERTDGPFTGTNDDGDWLVDEWLPPPAWRSDCDGDGYPGWVEKRIFGPTPNRDQDACGVEAWPSDLVSGGVPDSTDRVTIADLSSFVAPVRYLGTDVGAHAGDERWDLSPGKGLLPVDINVLDLSLLVAGPTGYPPMFGGARAFAGPVCPWPE